jgi:hypothetical protein
MGDDGNRQVAVTLGQIGIALGLDPEQFEALDLQLDGIHGAVNKLAENVAAPETSVAAEIVSLKQEISVGFAGMQQSLADLNNTIFERSVDLAKWMAAIALASANPADNTAQIQAFIDQIATGLNLTADEIQAALNQPKSQGE